MYMNVFNLITPLGSVSHLSPSSKEVDPLHSLNKNFALFGAAFFGRDGVGMYKRPYDTRNNF